MEKYQNLYYKKTGTKKSTAVRGNREALSSYILSHSNPTYYQGLIRWKYVSFIKEEPTNTKQKFPRSLT